MHRRRTRRRVGQSQSLVTVLDLRVDAEEREYLGYSHPTRWEELTRNESSLDHMSGKLPAGQPLSLLVHAQATARRKVCH